MREFSQYDAGWLHCFDSNNMGDILNANWNDLNIPARLTTLAMAGLPMIQKNNFGHLVAMQNIVRKRNIGVFFNNMNDLCCQLKDRDNMNILRNNMMKQRFEFSFDYHIPQLVAFFRNVIDMKKKHNQ